MGRSLGWREIPDGIRLYWEGLELENVQPMTDSECRYAEGSLSPWMRRLGAWPGLVVAVCFSGLWLSHPHLRSEISVSIVAITLCALMLAVAGVVARPHCRDKAVFRGPSEAVPSFSPLRKAMKRLRVEEKEIVAEVLPDGTLFALNARPLRRRLVVAQPVMLTKLGYAGDPGQLSDAERLELSMSAAILCKYPDGAAIGAATCLFQSLLDFRKSGRLSEKLAFLGIWLVVTAAALVWSRVWHVRLKRDIEEGVLESVGDRRVLRHSRKLWTVGDQPAKWRQRAHTRRSP